MRNSHFTGRIFLTFALFLLPVSHGLSQVPWLEDASVANINAAPVTGQVNGESFTARFGHMKKTGWVSFGESAFDHYTITLQDTQSGIPSSFGVELIVTVPKGELPDGKKFRRVRSASLADQPGPGRKEKGVLALAEFYSLTIRYRTDPNQAQSWISSGAEQLFTGRLELDKRRADKIIARLYVCFDDPRRSCAAGTAELELR